MSEHINETPLLEVKHLRKLFPVKQTFRSGEKTFIKAVDDVSFTLNPKETLGVVGESGCGKTTLGRTILRLYEPTGGKIIYDGETIYDNPLDKTANLLEKPKLPKCFPTEEKCRSFPGSVRFPGSSNDSW